MPDVLSQYKVYNYTKHKGGLTIHGAQDVAHLRRSACANLKVGAYAFVDIDTVVAMVSHREPYEAGRPNFIERAASGTIFGSAINCRAERSVFVPVREVFSKV